MKKLTLLMLIVICLFAFSSCSTIDYGIVKDKDYTPAHTSYNPTTIYVNKHIMIIPRYIHHAASWKILVENDDGRAWWPVSESFYDSVEVGDYVDRRDK